MRCAYASAARCFSLRIVVAWSMVSKLRGGMDCGGIGLFGAAAGVAADVVPRSWNRGLVGRMPLLLLPLLVFCCGGGGRAYGPGTAPAG
jgi:hypothetical protein